jgi:transcriptional regulator with XRE-family HTH domain
MKQKNISEEPGKRIRQLRKNLGLTRAEFESLTGVSANTLRYLETGQRELSILKARLLSTLFTYRFLFRDQQVTENYLLYGQYGQDNENIEGMFEN